jgi:hypothetical protein
MNKRSCSVFAAVCVMALFALGAACPRAQAQEVKAKAPLYSYISNWQIPRARWNDMATSNSADKPVLDKAMADGSLVGYGDDVNLVHSVEGATQDEWWSSMSMAGLMKVLNQFYANGSAEAPVLQSATKHWDNILVSRYYNWQSGHYAGAYVRVAAYTVKADAPDDAIETISSQVVAPLLEKLVADGTLREYEIDTEAITTQSPGTFWIVWVAATPEGLDTVNAAIQSTLKANPLQGPAFGSMVDFAQHRDQLLQGEGVYK